MSGATYIIGATAEHVQKQGLLHPISCQTRRQRPAEPPATSMCRANARLTYELCQGLIMASCGTILSGDAHHTLGWPQHIPHLDLLQHLLVALAIPGHQPQQQLVHEYPQAPPV